MITNNPGTPRWPSAGAAHDISQQISAAANRLFSDMESKTAAYGLEGIVRDMQTKAETAEGAGSLCGAAQRAYYFMPDQARTINRGFDVQAIRRDFPILQQRINGYPLAWLDNAATTQKPQCVIDALGRYYSEYNSNVHRGAHQLARLATEAYEQARDKVRRFIGAASRDEIVFVRGTTEAINLVASSFGEQNIRAGDEIILTQMEHHSNIVPWQLLAKKTGAVIVTAPVDEKGELLLGDYERLFTPRTKLVGAAYVSNVLGTVNPVRQMADIAHRQGALMLVDGAQSVSHMPINVQVMGADFFVFSGHKMYGPTGIGVLYAKRELLDMMPPYQSGGGMIRSVSFDKTVFMEPPEKFEAGTGNIADTVALGAAIDYLQSIGMRDIREYEQALTQQLMGRLQSIPGIRLVGTAPEKTSVVAFTAQSVQPDVIAKYLDQRGIAVRAGHHCAQPVLSRFGLKSAVRASIGIYNTLEETERLAEAVEELVSRY